METFRVADALASKMKPLLFAAKPKPPAGKPRTLVLSWAGAPRIVMPRGRGLSSAPREAPHGERRRRRR